MARNNDTTIRWQVSDGYAVGRRPQKTSLDLYLFDADMTDDQIRNEIDAQVKIDFDNRITYSVDNMDDMVAVVRAHLSESDEESDEEDSKGDGAEKDQATIEDEDES